MADNKSGAQHITRLDFDISGILQTLQEVDAQTRKYGIEIGKNWAASVKEGMDSVNLSNVKPPSIIDENQLKSAKSQLDKVAESYSKLAKTVMTYDADNNLLRGSITYDDSAGKKIVEQYQMIDKEWKKITSTQTNDYQKQEKQVQQVVSQIDRMIEKQKQFNSTVSKQKTSSVNRSIISENNSYISSLEKLNEEIKRTGYVTKEQRDQIDKYNSQIKELSGYYEEAGTKGQSFIQKTFDKAKWLAAFYVVNELKNGFLATIDIIKSTEDAVVDLQRVLNDNSISQNRMSDELYEIADQYGRTFDEVAEVSTKFAQAGYSWTETVELTKNTMLALNTAELDVTQSTEGLIAIMSQWNLEAEDYASVIDKINITADNFAINSENIVAALQRASSSAKNAGITLEETIGIITALGEATGRSGENIGTALNSLIIYTSKSGALETFAQVGSDAMKKVVADYQKGAVSIYDVWVQLSKELSNLTAQQQAALFQSDEYAAFADELEAQATEFTSQIKDVYGAAGTYRQNYFIALLNDLSTAEDAIKGMADAEGYSIAENERYMETLTANWNQLKNALAELAVQLGEAGLMDFLKGTVELGTGLAKTTKSLGGILPLLTAIGGVMVTLRAEKISQSVSDIGERLSNIPGKLKSIVTGTNAVTAATNAAATAEGAAAAGATAWQVAFGWIGLVATAISGLVMAISGVNSAIEESNRQSRERAQSYLAESDSISKLKANYAEIVNFTGDASEKTQRLTDFKKELITQYGLEKEAVEQLTGARKEEIDFLDKEAAANIKNAYVEIADQYDSAVKKMEQASQDVDLGISVPTVSPGVYAISEKDINILEQYLNVIKDVDNAGNVTGVSLQFPTSNLEEQRDILADIIASNSLNGTLLDAIKNKYDSINKEIEKNNESYSLGAEIFAEKFLIEEKTLDLIKQINEEQDLETQRELYDRLTESVKEQVVGLEAQEIVLNSIASMFPQFASDAEEAGRAMEESFSGSAEQLEIIEEKISALNDEIDGFQSSIDSLNSIMQDYNETGYLTVDSLQRILALGPEYISLLDFTANGVSVNSQKLQELVNNQANNVQQMIKQTTVAGLLEIANRYLAQTTDTVGVASSNAAVYSNTLEGALAGVVDKAMKGTLALGDLTVALADFYGGAMSASSYNSMVSEMYDYLGNVSSIANRLPSLVSGTQAWSDATASAASNMRDAAKAAADAEKEILNAKKKSLQDQKEAIRDRYDAEIEALREVGEEQDRNYEREEYYRRRQEILDDIERASVRSGVEYREQEAEARRNLEDLDREWAKKLEDWSIDDRIEELERLRDAEIAAIDAQIEAIDEKISEISEKAEEATSQTSQNMLGSYANNFVDPAYDITLSTMEDLFTNVALLGINSFKNMQNPIVNIAKAGANAIYEAYKVNAIDRLQSELMSLSTLGMNTILSAYNQAQNGGMRTTVNNNTNQNAYFYTSMYGNSVSPFLQSMSNTIFKKPRP